MRVCSLFSGIGGIDLGFIQAGFDVVWANEFDKDAARTYRYNLGSDHLVEKDIRKIDAHIIPDFDVLVAGFPCQPFSSAGKQKGFQDPRGTLFFEIARVVEAKRPQVVFLENYCVSLAESLMPAADISEQISLAGKEASGTGNMKFMINGALTVGTLDGANVEMLEQAGRDNMYIFGLNANEVSELWSKGYNPVSYYHNNERLKKVVDCFNRGFSGQSFSNIYDYLLIGQRGTADPYMCLADFDSYMLCKDRVIRDYNDREKWNRMSLMNIAGAGKFSADRSIEEYAKRIWKLSKVTLESCE